MVIEALGSGEENGIADTRVEGRGKRPLTDRNDRGTAHSEVMEQPHGAGEQAALAG